MKVKERLKGSKEVRKGERKRVLKKKSKKVKGKKRG